MTFLEEIELDDSKVVDDIILEIRDKFDAQISRRSLRYEREKINERFYNHEIDYCIAKSNKGYKRTNKDEDIIKSETWDLKQALDLLQKYHKSKKARGENINMKFQIVDNEMIYNEDREVNNG